MKNTKLIVSIVVILVVFVCLYYFIPIKGNYDKTLITISTFVFTICAGFFISRQGSRYSEIRKSVSNIDGNFSSLYRSSGHLGIETQEKMGDIIKIYYKNILESKIWNYNLTHKTTTLTDLHKILDTVASKTLSPIENIAANRVMLTLGNIQLERKTLVALCEERIPLFQLITTYFLSFTLLFALFIAIPSNNLIVESVLKAVFSTSVVIILILLNQLDRLELFEGIIGEHSARDVVDIIDNVK